MSEEGPRPEQPLARRDPPASNRDGAELLSSRALTTHVEAAAGMPAPQRSPFAPRLLLHYKWTILLGFTGTLVLGLACIWLVLKPQYSAEALLEIRSLIPRVIFETPEEGPIQRYEEYRGSQVQIMQSSTVLRRVLERDDVHQTAWHHEQPKLLDRLLVRPTQPLERLQDALDVQPIKRTEVVRVGVTHENPHDAMVLANGVLEEYITFSRERLSDEDKRIHVEVLEAKEKLEAEISYSQRAVSEARKDLRTGSPEELIAQRRMRLQDLETEVEQLELQLTLKRQRLDAAKEVLPESQPAEDGPYAYGDYADDAAWQSLHMDYKRAQGHLELGEKRFGPRSSHLTRLEHELKLAQELLEERQEYLDRLAGLDRTVAESDATGARGAGAGALQREIQQLESQSELLQRHLQRMRSSFDSDFNAAEALRRHTDELESNKEKLQHVLQRMEELREKGRVPATIRTIAAAREPSQPAKDRRFKLSIAALFGALAAGVALAALRVKFDPQIQEFEDVPASVGNALLGRLPLCGERGSETAEVSEILAESVRVVRTALLTRLDDSTSKVIQVTSAGVGSGKSTVAMLLGRSLAQCGYKVLLVDADLHQPSLAKRFQLPSEPGLIEVLYEPARAASAPRATGLPNLRLIASGAPVANGDAEALANGVFSRVLERWCRDYSIVLLDTPPLLLSADAAIISRQSHGTVLVVRERHCRLTEVLEALGILGSAGGRLLGTVFVGSSSGPASRYGYYYHYRNGQHGDRPAERTGEASAVNTSDSQP